MPFSTRTSSSKNLFLVLQMESMCILTGKKAKSNDFVVLSLIMCLLLTVCGCSAGYILHAAKGQFNLLSKSIPIEKALEKRSLGVREREHLRLVPKIKEFARDRLGLSTNGIYTTIYMEARCDTVYILIACPKDSLEPITWWFPVVGKMPYLGFFDLDKVQAKKRELSGQGLETVLAVTEAYSTLGWFDDPLTRNQIQASIPRFVETILHELTHATLYLKGQSAFNEGLATLVGKHGALQFLRKEYGALNLFSKLAEDSLHDERIFSAFLDSLLRDLEKLYSSSLSYKRKLKRREKIFLRAKQEFHDLKPSLRTTEFKYFETMELTNASLVAAGLYHRHFALFEEILKANNCSIRKTLRVFQTLARKNNNVLAAGKEWSIKQKGSKRGLQAPDR